MIYIYLTPFDENGEFGEEIDITPDVDLSSLGRIKRALDNSTYDIGILRYNNLSLKLHNSRGKFSDVTNVNSIFKTRRAGSKIRVTWAPGPPAYCGVAICGEVLLSEEITVYRGILDDQAAVMNAADQIISFQVLSYDSTFSKVLVPYADLDGADTLEDILLKILDQPAITKYLDVDGANLELAVNFVPDDLTWFENKTGKEAIEAILLISNSIVYVDDEAVIATGRAAAGAIAMSFYGQASQIGNENIVDIQDFRTGQNRIINLVRWREDGAAVADTFSVERWGSFPKDIEADFVTDAVKQASSAAAIVAEFKDPRKELELHVVMDPDTLALKFKEKVNIDYPTVLGSSGANLPIVGITKIGDQTAPLPGVLWDFTLSQEEEFKIMGVELDLKNETVALALRGAQ